MFSGAYLSLAAGKMRENITCHRRLSLLHTLENHRWLPVSIFSVKIAALGGSGLLEGFSKLVSNFKEAS
jgi:hypothetical protein